MKHSPLSVLVRTTAIGLTLSSVEAAPPAPVASGFTPPQPALWAPFNGDARNYGTGRGEWTLRHTAFQENALYLNGQYQPYTAQEGLGYIANCGMGRFTKERFTVALRFKRDPQQPGRHLLMGGTGFRWFGLQVGPSGGLEVIFNNSAVVLPVAGVQLREEWNWLICSVNLPARKCLLFLNGTAAEAITLPADFQLNVKTPVENYDNAWSFTNYGNSKVFRGWIDEFLFYDRELTAPEITGLAQRRDMLGATEPKLTTPPEITENTPAAGNQPPARGTPLSSADLQERTGTLAISSVGGPYSLAARFAGQYTWNAQKVKVRIAQGEIIRQAKGSAPERQVRSFQLIVRRENATQKHMDIVGRSPLVPVEAAITHGQSVLVEDMEVLIPLSGNSAAELGRMWLGILIVDTPADKPAQHEGTCVAEAATCLDGSARPAPIALGAKGSRP